MEVITREEETALKSVTQLRAPYLAVPNYELLTSFADGSSGELYLARNTELGCVRVVKILYPGHDGLEREALSLHLQRVKHPDRHRLMPVLDFGRASNGHFYTLMPRGDDLNGATEFLPDQYRPATLHSHMERYGRLSIEETLIVADSLLTALICLHGCGLIHRDVNPRNVLRRDGLWILTDYGVMAPREALRHTDPLVGRPASWFLPKDEQLDYDTDLYSLARTLFCLLTEIAVPAKGSRDPWDEFETHWMRVRGGTENQRLRLREILLKAGNSDPERRYATAVAMHREVAAVMSQTVWVQLRIPGDFDRFTDADQAAWLRRISALGLHVLAARHARGSILLHIQLTPAHAELLQASVADGLFRAFGVTQTQIVEEPLSSAAPAAKVPPEVPLAEPLIVSSASGLGVADARSSAWQIVMAGMLSSTLPLVPKSDSAAAEVGAAFGRYRLVERYRRGGMGEVWRAHDDVLDRVVALKIPQHRAGCQEWLERFRSEAAMAARFPHHPNLCPIYDFGDQNGLPYLVMPFLEGRSLAQIVQQAERLPPYQAAQLVARLASAMALVHNYSIIHRDLKPANILVNPLGEPVLLDFGLARWLDKEDNGLTASGTQPGTPAYMSPEQVRGEHLSPASDIYSLGVILYVLLSGRLPFADTEKKTLFDRILEEVPPPPSRHGPCGDTMLDFICLRAMAKQPKDRLHSMRTFALELEAYCMGLASSNQSREKVVEEGSPRSGLGPA